MDIEYTDVISFEPLKKIINERGLKQGYVAREAGFEQSRLSGLYKGIFFPKTDMMAKVCSILNVPVSKIVSFKIDSDEKKKEWFASRELPYTPPSEPEGVLTYEPFRLMTSMYLDYYNSLSENEKTLNDLLDKIEPYRRRNGLVTVPTRENVQQAMKARGFEEGYKSERTDRKYKAVGLTPVMRNKLKTDKPLNIRSVYDICNFFGCSIDWVVSYK